MSEILEPLTAFMQSRCGKSEGIAFVDSTPLRVCENIRIPEHKTFADVAGRAKLVLRKHSIIETINDQLKNIFNLEHNRHHSLTNFVVNAVACWVAYSYQEKKPSLNLICCL